MEHPVHALERAAHRAAVEHVAGDAGAVDVLDQLGVGRAPDRQAEVIAALPEPLLAGSDVAQLKRIIERYRTSLYPENVRIDLDAVQRVVRAQEIAKLLKPGAVDLNTLLDVTVVEG